jgi:hypothetical protein
MGHSSSRPKANERDEARAGFPTRFAAYGVLYGAGIPACIWLEDALLQFGIPTVVFELFLLVPDVDAAVRALISAGYRRGEPRASVSGPV